MSAQFYVISLKWTRRADNLITFWRAKAEGYAYRLEDSGRYTLAEIEAKPDYLNNGEDTIAVPCEVVEALAIRVGDAKSKKLDADRGAGQRVVEFKHLKTLRKQRRDPAPCSRSSSF